MAFLVIEVLLTAITYGEPSTVPLTDWEYIFKRIVSDAAAC